MSVRDDANSLHPNSGMRLRSPPRGWHGHSVRGNVSPTYRSWLKMRERCLNPNADNFHNYGGRGIRVCSRWKRFVLFLADMGERPDGTTLDRKNVNGNYNRMNCVWSTKKEQRANRRDSRHIV